jgi:hypothetical protein
LKTYTTRLTDVEEQITFVDAQRALNKDKWWYKTMKKMRLKK